MGAGRPRLRDYQRRIHTARVQRGGVNPRPCARGYRVTVPFGKRIICDGTGLKLALGVEYSTGVLACVKGIHEGGLSESGSPTFHEVMRWTDEESRAFLERLRWPEGPQCPKCGALEPYTITRKAPSKNAVRSFYKCRGCKRQVTATVGTIFEDSKIPLHKWLAAIYLMCSSKKGISAHQLHRMLGITYKSAWFMCHRIREATKRDDFPQLSGVVEADETYMGARTKRGHKVHHERIQDEIALGIRPKPERKPPYQDKTTVERGGSVVSAVIPRATAEHVKPIMTRMINVDDAVLMIDRHPAYRNMDKMMPHETINHELEYVRGPVHTQTYRGLLKLSQAEYLRDLPPRWRRVPADVSQRDGLQVFPPPDFRL